MTITKEGKTSSTAFQDLFPGADTGHGGTVLGRVLLLAITARGASSGSRLTSFRKKSRVTYSILTPPPLAMRCGDVRYTFSRNQFLLKELKKILHR